METVLIVDDEKNYPLILKAVLEDAGFEILTAHSGAVALSILRQSDIDLVITDMKMPKMDGIQLLENIKSRDQDLPVIMMTAYGTVEKAVEAMQKGAFNYILKPFENDKLVIIVEKALDSFRLVKENRHLKQAIQSRYRFGNIIGKSKPMQSVFEIIQKVSPTTATILIEGESGTGKELVAKSIHFNSPRRDKPFVAVNCAALAETLLESELFGHEKGAFTGAVAMKKGRFELADGGSLFLDEIGELPASLQVKLLRVLQEKNFERVGGVRPVMVDIRLIAATNRHLKTEVQAQRFREDLFFRLNVVTLTLPPLRERNSDLRLLAMHFIDKYANQRTAQPPVTGFDPEAERLLFSYPWPGNIRELENVIERAMILSTGDRITLADLPEEIKKAAGSDLGLKNLQENATLYETLEMVEINMIKRALHLADNVQSKAAELLGIGKSGLNQKIKKFNIDLGSKV